MSFQPRVIAHEALTPADLTALRALFDREYFTEHGPWEPDSPYGYSPASTHAIVLDGAGAPVAHVGFQPREITVGRSRILIAGTGGVLVDQRFRGQGLGELVMSTAQAAMRATSDLEYGYLGCREEVVPFYERTGWHRVHVTERSVSRRASTNGVPTTVIEQGSPVLISPLRRDVDAWPPGTVDLHGRPW